MKLMYVAVGYLAYYLNSCLFFVLFLNLFSVNYFEIFSDKETTAHVVRNFASARKYLYTRHINGKDVLTGFYVDWKYLAFVDRRDDREMIYLLTSQELYKRFIKREEVLTIPDPPPPVKSNNIAVYIRKGSYTYFYYHSMNINLTQNAIGAQIGIIQDVVSIFNKNRRATIFVDGVCCAGKSMLGYLLAKELNGKYCHTFNPTDAGDNLTSLLVEAGMESDVIVVVLEEVDILLRNVHNGTVPVNYKVPTSVHNKMTWTNFLDDMFLFKNVILLMTSNTPKAKIDELDCAYLREGRVHAAYSMNENLKVL
jgi:hypothetical protein